MFSTFTLSKVSIIFLFISITLGSFSLAWGQEDTNAEVFFREDQFYLGASFMILESDQEDFSPRGLSRHFQWGFIRDIPISNFKVITSSKTKKAKNIETNRPN